MTAPETRVFRTSDGYRVRKIGDKWYDAVAATPEDSDLTFDSDPATGLPVDCWGEPLEGDFEE
jgi:hypothetical protein